MYVAFAASGPGIRVNKGHRKRWAIETGCRMARRAMTGTHPRSKAVRNLCLVLSLAAHNAWVMACAGVRRAHRDGWLPQKFLLGVAFVAAGALAARPRRKPPPEPPPPVLP